MTSTPPTIALVGRQNAGKTSLLMHLTGRLRRPVNFPGSSVSRDEAPLVHDGRALRVVDLPGLASLEPLSPDEAITVRWLQDPATRPDVILAVLDATRLPLELLLVEALRSLEIPLVLALTRVDRIERPLDLRALEAELGCPAFAVNAHSPRSPRDFDPLRSALCEALGAPPSPPHPTRSPADLERLAARASGRPDRADKTYQRTFSDRIDAIVLHRALGLPLFFLVVFGIFQLLFHAADPLMGLIEDAQGGLGGFVSALFGDPRPGPFESFLVDGLIGGLGAALVFLPQIAILIALVALLESSGYMARAAFLLDRILSRVGLSGRSFVPLASSFACAVPGILATRTIDNERERIATILIAPLMSCSARLPVYVLLIGAFFPASRAALVLFGLYGLGILVAALVAALLRRSALKGPRAALMLELPDYQRPSWRVVSGQVLTASRAFLLVAGTIILAASVVIWALSYFPRSDEVRQSFAAQAALISGDSPEAAEARAELARSERGAQLEVSYLARVGKAITPIFEPAGFDWRVTVGILAAFPARELIIPTLGILYRVGDVDPGDYSLDATDGPDSGLRARLRESRRDDGSPAWTDLIALAVMVFFALCSQCMATLATIRKETGSWKWPLVTFLYMTALAWLAAVLVYQVGSALGLAG